MRTAVTNQAYDLIQMLPDEELITVNSLLKYLVCSWDSEYIRVTINEKDRIDMMEASFEIGEFFLEEDVWGE